MCDRYVTSCHRDVYNVSHIWYHTYNPNLIFQNKKINGKENLNKKEMKYKQSPLSSTLTLSWKKHRY